MPVTYRIDKSRRIVFTTAYGRVEEAEVLAHQDKLRRDPDFDPSFAQLFDTHGVTSVQVSTAAIRRLAQRNPFGAGARRAFIMPTDELYGLGRMFQILTEDSGHEVHIFRDEALARSWLGLEPQR